MRDETPPPPSTAAPASPASPAAPQPSRTLRSLCASLWGMAALLCTVPVLLLGGLLALPWTSTGSAWLLAALPNSVLQAEGVQGALLRGEFRVERLRIPLTAQRHLGVEGLRWAAPVLDWSAGAPRLHWARIDATSLALVGPGSGQPLTLPRQLVLPLTLQVDSLHIDRIEADDLAGRPVQAVQGRLALRAGPQAQHSVDALQLRWDRLQLQGQARIAAAAPMTLQAALGLTPVPATTVSEASATNRMPTDWQLQLEGQGPLADLALAARLRARDQALQADARLQLEQPWPLTRLHARLQALDLSALLADLPTTALSGELDLAFPPPAQATSTSTPTAPTAAVSPGVRLVARLDNARAGAVATGQWPVRQLRVTALSDLRHPESGRVEALSLELGDARRPAGRVEGSGRWDIRAASAAGSAPRRIALALDARLSSVQPALIDRRAPALQLTGPVQWTLDAALGPDAAPPAAAASAASSPAATTAPTPPAWQTRLATDLQGQWLASALPDARLQLQAELAPQRLRLEQLQLQTGTARLSAEGTLQRDARNWSLQLASTLQDFDPAVWWNASRAPVLPQTPPSDSTRIEPPDALQRLMSAGRHRLGGQARVDIQLPRTGPDSLQRLAQLQGRASIDLLPSLLAGQPISGRIAVQSTRLPPGPAGDATRTAPDLVPGLTVPRDLPRLLADVSLHLGPDSSDGATRATGAHHATAASLPDPGPGALVVQAHGELDPKDAQDTWRLAWRAASLAPVQPWLRLLNPDSALPPLAGLSQGEAVLQGRWPRVQSRGQVQLPRLTVGSLRSGDAPTEVEDLAVTWQMGSQAQDTLAVQARLGQLRSGGVRVEKLDLQARGTSADHTLTVQMARATAPRAPSPSGTGNGNSNGSSNGSAAWLPSAWTAALQAQGRWINEPDARRLGWQGQLQALSLTAASGTTGTSAAPAVAAATPAPPAPSPALLQLLQPTTVRVVTEPAGLHLTLGATRVALLESRLALDELDWQRSPADASAPADARRPDRLQLRARLEPLPVAPLLVRAQPGFGWGGDLRVAGSLAVRATPEHFQADAELRRDGGDLTVADTESGRAPQRLGLAAMRLALSAHDGRWQFTQSLSGGNLGSLEGSQTLEAAPSASWPGLAAPVQGRIDLQVAQLGNWGRWLPAGWRLTGRLSSQARVAGTLGAPTFSGDLNGEQIGVRNPLQGVDWRDAQLQVVLAGDTARIDHFSVRAGAGTLSATGTAELGASPLLRLKARADRFAALQRVDRRVVASGEADLTLDARSTVLRGRLRADEGRFDFTQSDAPSLADDVDVSRGEVNTEDRERVVTPRSRRTNTLDLRVELGPAFLLKGRGLSTRLAGDLRLSSPGNRLAVQGTIQAVDGTYAAYGQKLRIDRGNILFTSVPENPRLDIIATRPDLEDLRVGVTVTGTAQSPRIRLFSEPTLSDTDRLSWLLLGRASDGLGRTDLALLQRAAYALIAGESDAPSLIEQIGLNEFSVRQGEGDTRETVVTLGKQLSRRWYLGYERSLNAATGTWQLIYRLAQRYTLRAQSGTDNALDFIWTWKWGEPAGTTPPPDDDAPASPTPAR